MILDGRKIRDIILDEVREEVSKLDKKLKLVIIQVGNEDAGNIYLKQKENMCKYVGFEYEVIKLRSDVTNIDIISVIDRLNNDISVSGIMVQLPLPGHIDKKLVLNRIDTYKDVDGLTDSNMDGLVNREDGLFSSTALGIMELLKRYDIDIRDKNIVVIGRSNLVGIPVSILCNNIGANVYVCHTGTKDISMYTKEADIVISAVGIPKLVTREMIKDDSIIIDVGINNTSDGICGDVDYNQVLDKVKYITPVPGGVGPMTVAMLAKNMIKAYKLK